LEKSVISMPNVSPGNFGVEARRPMPGLLFSSATPGLELTRGGGALKSNTAL
jgi:hypothetical protein